MEATVAQKSFLPQDVHNPSLEVHSWKETDARSINIDVLTERMKYPESAEGRETNSSWGEHKWQIYMI